MTVPLLPPPHSLLFHRPVDPLVHLLHPACELPVVQVLLDQRQEEPVTQLALGHDPLDDPVVLQVVADVCRLEHGDPEIGEYQGERPAHAADDGDDDEEEEPEPLDQEDLVVDDVEAEDAESVVDVDGAGERA